MAGSLLKLGLPPSMRANCMPENQTQKKTNGSIRVRKYLNRSMVNVLRMGHCAPTVMQTILDVENVKNDRLVKLTAGLPGGIGNTGFECGGVTAPLISLGLHYPIDTAYEGLPLVLHKGHALCERFLNCNNTLLCKKIRGTKRFPKSCISVIRHSGEVYDEIMDTPVEKDIPDEIMMAYRHIVAHFTANNFHCSHAVLNHLSKIINVDQEILKATSGFFGGTLLKGMTCSAFTAGVMAVGLKIGQIENSPLRVLRMIGLMILGGNAFDDNINEFNRIMNLGNRLASWFADEFGSTQCSTITGCDFSSLNGVKNYIDRDCLSKCRVITKTVAGKVQSVLTTMEANS